MLEVFRALKRIIRNIREFLFAKCMVLKHRKNVRIILGSSGTKQPGWISTDIPVIDLTDEKTFSRLLRQGTVSNFLAEHVWEHLDDEQAMLASRNCFNYLRSGGRLRLAVPDGFHPHDEYLIQVKPGGTGAGAHDHKKLYNYQTLSELLKHTGFNIHLLEWFDEQGHFHRQQWDETNGYVKRSSCNDQRNFQRPLSYTSIIIDAIKP